MAKIQEHSQNTQIVSLDASPTLQRAALFPFVLCRKFLSWCLIEITFSVTSKLYSWQCDTWVYLISYRTWCQFPNPTEMQKKAKASQKKKGLKKNSGPNPWPIWCMWLFHCFSSFNTHQHVNKLTQMIRKSSFSFENQQDLQETSRDKNRWKAYWKDNLEAEGKMVQLCKNKSLY